MKYLNKSLCLVFAILTSLFLFSCASPASGIGGDGGDVSVNQVPVGGSPFMGGGAGAGVAPGSTPQAAGAMPPAGSLTFKSSNSSSNSNGFYSEGLSSLGWTSLELDVNVSGTITHHSLNPGNSIEIKNLDTDSTVTVTGTAKLPDGTVRNVKSDTYTVKRGDNKINLKLYCEYKYWRNGCYDTSCNGGPDTYMSNQSITLPVASDHTVAAGRVYPFAGWIEYAPGLSTHGNYYIKGTNVPAGQVTGDVEFFADYGFALYKQTAGGTKTYIDSSTGLSIATGQLVELKAEDIDGNTSGIITGVTITSGAGNVTMESGKIKGVSAGNAIVTYAGTTKYGAPWSTSVNVNVVPMSIQIKNAGTVVTSHTQTLGDSSTFNVEIEGSPIPVGASVRWVFDIPADPAIGFEANKFEVTSSAPVDFTPKTSVLSNTKNVYKKADDTFATGNTIPDTYSGTITITAYITVGGNTQEISTDFTLTGYTLPTNPFAAAVDATKTATMNMTSYGSGSSQCWIQNETGASNLCMYVSPTGLPSKSPDGAEWVWKFKLNNVDKSPTVTVNNDGSCTVPLTELGLLKTQGGTVLADWTMSYHGLKKSGSKSAVIRAAVPAIKLLVIADTGCSVDANGTTVYDITQIAAGAKFKLKVVEDNGSDTNITTPASSIGGSPEFKITFVSNTNDYGITTKPDGYLLNTYNANISADHTYTIGATDGSGFGLGVGDSATITLSVTYTLYGITRTAAVTTLNIKGTSTPVAGMYYYKKSTGGYALSSTKPSGSVLGVVISASGNEATIIRNDVLGVMSARFADSEANAVALLPVTTSSSDGLQATEMILTALSGASMNNYPAFNNLKNARISDGVNWYIPAIDELSTFFGSPNLSAIKTAMPSVNFEGNKWRSSTGRFDSNGAGNPDRMYSAFDGGSVNCPSVTSTRYSVCFFAKITLP